MKYVASNATEGKSWLMIGLAHCTDFQKTR